MPRKREDVFKQVDMSGKKTGCWPWKGTVNTNGKPYFHFENKMYIAYRVVYELVHGVELTTDQYIKHTCNNAKCCNPSHLYMEDTDPDQPLSRHDIINIKKAFANNERARDIADQFGVHISTVYRIRKGDIHSQITLEKHDEH